MLNSVASALSHLLTHTSASALSRAAMDEDSMEVSAYDIDASDDFDPEPVPKAVRCIQICGVLTLANSL